MKYVATFTIIENDKKREITKFFSEKATLYDIMNSVKHKILNVVIKELEDEVGFAIFERSNRGVTTTAEGADFIVDEIFMKDGELYAKAIDEDRDDMTFRLYPIGENVFGRKGGMLKLTFGENCLMFEDHTCKKL